MSNYFNEVGTPNYSQFIHLSRYSRWLEDKGRRETWEETTRRYVDFFANRFPELKSEIFDLQKHILNFKVMPSMRCLMTAGKALERSEVACYNCAYLAIDNQRAFDEVLYILLCGTGIGFSVERQYVNKLPEVAESFYDSDTTIVVPDSKIGWATSFRELVALLYGGKVPKWDLSRLRPAGARLKTFGGRSSGPQPLDNLFRFAVNIFKRAAGRRLNSLECHDLICKVADTVVVGGVRRAATLSLSNVSDDRMRAAKSGQWWVENKQRRLANNSACYTEKPELEVFMREWMALYGSKSGERGIFNRVAAKKKVAENGRRVLGYDLGSNPCNEILLRSAGLCNLSEIIVRPDDTLDDLKEKAKIATIFGTLQSTLTNFKYLRKIWRNNTEEERLLGVSMTGIMDHKTLSNPDNSHLKRWLAEIKETCIETNKEWAKKLGIEESVAITCVKPSGCRPINSLVTTNSGIFTLEDFMYNHDPSKDWCDISGITAVGGGPVTKSFINGEAPVLSIKMSFGMEVESTPNHQWYIKDKGWVRTDEIKPGDQIDINCGIYKSEAKSISADASWLIGYLYEDGAQCKFRNDIHKAQQILKEQFDANYIKDAKFLHYSGDVIPLIIRKSSQKSIIAFLGGLIDADTWVSDEKIVYTTSNCEFSKHLQHVAWTVGIALDRQKNGEMYSMTLTDASDKDALKFLAKYCSKTKTFGSQEKPGIVKAIEPAGIMPTFDVETAKHWFFAGSVRSHNTVSQLCNTASGIHARYSDYYIRRVRIDSKDPICEFMIKEGFPNEADVMNDENYVFSFPIKAPINSVKIKDIPALKQLEVWKIYQDHWCEHKPSCSIYYSDDDFLAVGAWVWTNFDDISGISFLPYSDHIYDQAPYESISEEKYKELSDKIPEDTDWSKLKEFEEEDNTAGSQTYACSGGSCEVVDLVSEKK